MKEQLEQRLERDFPFMEKSGIEDEENLYKRFGCECDNGWYDLLHDLCQAISERYAREGTPADIVILQIKEKFGTLRFYYEFEGAPCPIQAFDFLGDGISLRLGPKDSDADEATRRLRRDISDIVRSYEKKSGTVCEICGAPGELRPDMSWVRTLCGDCYGAYLEKMEESKRRRAKETLGQ